MIERQRYDPDMGKESGWVVRREAGTGRRFFGRLVAAVVGASNRADKHTDLVKVADIVSALRQYRPRRLCEARSWDEWKKSIKTLPTKGSDAALLLLIGHTDIDERARVAVLEIGGDTLMLSAIVKEHVGAGNALVILLGCNTVGGGGEVNRFATRFRHLGAEVVLATTTAVLGEHAVPLAKALVEGLAEADGSSGLGELMRALRLRFLLKGVPIGLAVVAFGDADWQLNLK